MRKHVFVVGFIGLMVLVALGAALALAPDAVRAGPPQQADGASAPQVIETDPLAGEEMALDGAVTLYFDQPMDMDSVQDLLAVEPATPLAFEVVDEATLRFVAEKDWLRGTQYVFRLPAEVESAAGEPLSAPFELVLQTVGYLEVSEVLPAPDSTFIETDSAITVIFNRPVVPLVTVEDMDTLPDPLALDPAVEGEGEWLNTSIYVFRPERLEGGTTYTATIAAGLADVTGGVLAEDYTWTFETLPPAILAYEPESMAGNVALDAPVTLTFNQAMDPDSVEAAFILAEQETGRVRGEFSWNEDASVMTFTPAEPLAMEGFYTARVEAEQVRSASGAARLEDSLAWNFTTVGQPRITRTEPGEGSAVDPYGGFSIYFATAMDEDTLADKVQIDPAPARDYDSYYYSYDNRLQLSFTLEPSADYTVTILPGMADVYGNTIDSEQVVRFTTRPYDPSITLNTPGRVGIYSAYNPETRLFATHLNVEQLDLELHSLSLEQLARLNGPDSWELERTFALRPETLLRRWSIPLESALNERWYELLAITTLGESTTLSCPGAPEPRLEVGGMATVITDPDPLRAREGSPTGEIVDLLYKDYTLPVTGGPVCENGFIWWQVALRDGSLAWVAEGDSSEYYLELTTPASAPTEESAAPPVQTAAVGGEAALPPGAYYLRVTSPETQLRGNDPLNHMMVVATANVTFKFSSDSALAWVTDLETGVPVAGVPVVFYDAAFDQVASSVTDADGLAQASIPEMENLYEYLYAVVNTPDAFGFAVSDWTWGVEPYDFNQMPDYYPVDVRGNLYTDRPIYRPGQPVYFRGVLRARDDVTYSPPPMDELPIRIEDNLGEIVYEATLPLTEYGTFSGEFTLAEDAGLGYYQIIAQVEDAEYYSPRNFSVPFGVAEYRAPEFQVTVTPEVPAVVQGEDISVLVEGRYFFGGAVSNADVSYTVLSQNYFFNYTGLDRYAFTDYNYDEGPGEYYGMGGYGGVIAEGAGTTDADGRFLIELPADLGEKTQSQTLTIEVSITDESDQAVFNRESVIVHQGELYVGVQPEEYVGLAGEPNTVNLISVDWDSAPVSGQEIEYTVVERRWSSVQEEDEAGRTVWTWEVEELPVEDASGSVTTDEDGKAAFEFVPPVAGTYKVVATARDSRGNVVRSSAFLWVSGQEYVSWRQQNSNRVDLITDRDSYRVGDMAEVLIASPWQGEATALVTIERGDVLRHEVIALETNSTVYRFPIEDAYAPNVFVSVLLVKGVDANTPTAEFRMGMAGIAVDPERREITVTVRPDRELAGPRETVTYTVETTDYTGNPVQAEVGIGLTDLAVLTIAEPNSQPLMQTFYGQQGLGVRTAVPLTLSVDQLTQTTLDTVKGGGGGGGEGGIFEVRQEFVDTPYWNPTLVTDEDGQATFDVTLPDNLTTWRLDARAVTAGRDGITLVGQTEFDLISTKPLLLRPVTPRFFVVGDVVTLAAVVNNNTEEALDVEASLQAAGVAFNSPQDISAEVAAGGRQRFEWVVTVEDVENVDLTFYASGDEGAFTDASKPGLGQGDDRLLPVYRYEAPEVVGTGGMIAEPGSVTEAISLPRRFDVTQGELDVRVDTSLAAGTLDGLTYLENFPHQ
ncbi:MAG: Ig-like domain-containing protein, partial [Anaerolineae bacterium]|nr:Ig-like domain-containing protein [Anaerolineae bacterium]